MQKSRFFAIFACFSRYRKCSNLRVAEKNFEVIVVFLKIYILMVRKPPSFALWDFFLPFSLYFPIFTWLLGMLHDGLNMPYIKFGNPVPNVSEMLNLLSSWTKKMSLDESGRRQNPLKPYIDYVPRWCQRQQGRVHGNQVADGWAGAVMRKLLGIQKCDGPTDWPTNWPTWQDVVACPRLKTGTVVALSKKIHGFICVLANPKPHFSALKLTTWLKFKCSIFFISYNAILEIKNET